MFILKYCTFTKIVKIIYVIRNRCMYTLSFFKFFIKKKAFYLLQKTYAFSNNFFILKSITLQNLKKLFSELQVKKNAVFRSHFEGQSFTSECIKTHYNIRRTELVF